MKKAKLLFGIFAALAIVFFTGCTDMNNDEQNQANGDQLGHLVIKLTDAPFPFDMIESATVNITKVEIRKVSEGDEDGYPYIELPLPEESNEFNLLDLRNGVTADLAEMGIEPGNYDLIRLYVDEAVLTVNVEEELMEFKVKVPSGQQTGIKIFMDPDLKVVSELTTEVVLDFNLEKSFVLKGNANTPAGIKGFNFKPVVKAVNNTTDGTLEGEVVDADTDDLLPGISVWIERADTLVASASTDELGYYAIPGLMAGSYDVIAGSDAFYNDTVLGVQIVEGNLTVQNFALTPITGMLEGVVKDLDADTLLPGASVWIELEEFMIDSVGTDEDGYYTMPGIRLGTYDVIAALDGFVNDTLEGVEIVDGSVTVDFELVVEEETTTTTDD